MEWKRQTVHMMAGFLIILLRVLPYWAVLCVSLFGMLFNLFLLPRLMPSVMRNVTGDRRGVVFYPVSVATLVVLLPNNMAIVAGAWAILSFGDGMATMIGHMGRPVPLRWNPNKTVQGTTSCFVFGAAACAAAMWVVDPGFVSDWRKWGTVAVVASAIAAWVESLPLPVNDNLTVPLTAALVLWLAQFVDVEILGQITGWNVIIALLINGVLVSIMTSFRIVHGSATWAGLAVGSVIMVCGGWQCYILLLFFFAVGTWATQHGMYLKTIRGVAEENEGRRGARNVIANCGVPMVFAFLAASTHYTEWMIVALVASLATAMMDTLASEFGQVYGRYPVLPSTGETVPIGTKGAISMEGTLSGLVGAIFLAVVAWGLGAIPAVVMPVVVLAAFAGSSVESLISAILRVDFAWRNDILNFGNTLFGGILALFIAVQTIPPV